MKLRIAWVRCPECGRNGMAAGCFIVQKQMPGFLGFLWKDLLTTYDHGGSQSAEHFPSQVEARAAIDAYFTKPEDFRVVEELVR